jgi:DNA-binding response OmpR family regulator
VVRDNLEFEGFEVAYAQDGATALKLATDLLPDLILLDVALPDISGFELFGSLGRRFRTPVIFLTARSQKADKLRGLNLGADDYITKPFDIEELLARVHAVLRRTHAPVSRLALGDVVIDFEQQRATRGDEVIHLTGREFDLLRYLAERRDRIIHRDELLREVWGYVDAPLTRSVDHAISRLRKKIEQDAHAPQFIHTVRGDGYCLTPGAAGHPPDD